MHKRRNQGVLLVKVRDGMSHLVLTIGPAHTLRQAARMMSARHIGAAVVIDPEHAGIGILTERDILNSVAAGEDPDAELAAQHRTEELTYASPDWTLEQAAAAMVKGGFRHLVVVEGHDVAGLLSMRDIVRCWTSAERPAGPAAGRRHLGLIQGPREPGRRARATSADGGCTARLPGRWPGRVPDRAGGGHRSRPDIRRRDRVRCRGAAESARGAGPQPRPEWRTLKT